MAFYGIYFALIAVSAALVLIPGVPLGLLTNAVQSLAGVLLPSASVFLLMLCNDEAVLGPWTNSRTMNIVGGAVVVALVLLSVILTAAVLFPGMSSELMMGILVGGGAAALVVGAIMVARQRKGVSSAPRADAMTWKMPPLDTLPPMRLTTASRAWMALLRGYLIFAVGIVVYKAMQLAMA